MIVCCERLDDFGRGVCVVDGKVVFVPNLLPSEKAKIEIIIDKKNYMVGSIVKLIKKSKNRVISKCSYRSCGCALMNMSYKDTLEYKKDKVIKVLKKFGGFSFDDVKINGSKNMYGYRNKISLKVIDGKIGYFKNGSNDLIEIKKCLICSDRINKLIKVLRKEDLTLVSSIVIKDMDSLLISINGKMDITRLKKFSDSIYMSGKCVYGDKYITNSILGYKFLVSDESFFQVNNEMTEKLYSKVLEYAGKGNSALDLYSGTGTIGILLSKNYKNVYGVEINKSAVECANENKMINNISNVSFNRGNANKITNISSDLVVVDPARAGIMKDGIKNILKINPKRIVYVSCNPVTLARDLKELKNYKIKDISLFDMFPWTYHVESLVLLERR